MNFTITVRSDGIEAVAFLGSGEKPLGKFFPVGHEGPAYEQACTELAKHIWQLKQTGLSEFHFTKTDDVSVELLYAVATNIAAQVPGPRTRHLSISAVGTETKRVLN